MISINFRVGRGMVNILIVFNRLVFLFRRFKDFFDIFYRFCVEENYYL